MILRDAGKPASVDDAVPCPNDTQAVERIGDDRLARLGRGWRAYGLLELKGRQRPGGHCKDPRTDGQRQVSIDRRRTSG